MDSFLRGESEYFTFSQQIKQQILAKTTLLERLQKHLDNEPLEIISKKGNSNYIYRVELLENDLWIALRERRYAKLIGTQPTFLRKYELYAQNAEACAAKGRRVTRFCIGVRKEKYVALLVEDLTQGNSRKIRCEEGWITGEFTDTKETVWIDLDNDDPKETMALKYLAPENCILL